MNTFEKKCRERIAYLQKTKPRGYLLQINALYVMINSQKVKEGPTPRDVDLATYKRICVGEKDGSA